MEGSTSEKSKGADECSRFESTEDAKILDANGMEKWLKEVKEILQQWEYSMEHQRRASSKSPPRTGDVNEDRGRTQNRCTVTPNQAHEKREVEELRQAKRLAHNQRRSAEWTRSKMDHGQTIYVKQSPYGDGYRNEQWNEQRQNYQPRWECNRVYKSGPPPPPGFHSMYRKFATLYIRRDKPISQHDLFVINEY